MIITMFCVGVSNVHGVADGGQTEGRHWPSYSEGFSRLQVRVTTTELE